VGYSTAGKSSIRRALWSLYPHAFDYVDTDKEIASRDCRKHIAQVYLKRRDGASTRPVLDYVERVENDVLRGLQRRWKPLLIITGPGVPLRAEWQPFLSRVSPDAVVYLELKDTEVLAGLQCRANRDDKRLKERPGYGCWEQCQTREYDAGSGRWLPVSNSIALSNIRANMKQNVAAYQKAQTMTQSGRLKHAAYDALVNDVAKALGLA
jgi:shikimate kinase